MILKTQKPLPTTYPRELKTLGDHLLKRRLDLGLYQREIAEILSADEASVFNWENNRAFPSLRLIPTIIRFLGYNPFGNVSNMTFGEQIIAYRQIHGISQKELAEKLGIDPGTLGRWEKNERTLLKEKLQELESVVLPKSSIDDNGRLGQ